MTKKPHVRLSSVMLSKTMCCLHKNKTDCVLSENIHNPSVPDKAGVSGQKPEKADHLTRLNKW